MGIRRSLAVVARRTGEDWARGSCHSKAAQLKLNIGKTQDRVNGESQPKGGGVSVLLPFQDCKRKREPEASCLQATPTSCANPEKDLAQHPPCSAHLGWSHFWGAGEDTPSRASP